MIEYKTLTYSLDNIQSLPTLGKDNWQLCSIYEGKMFLSRPIKKEVKSKALTTESNKGIAYLKMQRQQIDSGEEIHYPDFVNDRKQWSDFINYWTQKNSEDGKMHSEKQKTFEIRARFSVWCNKNNKFQKSNIIG